jgi:hypothetical protein
MPDDTKKLIPILVVVGVLMCGCVALPVVGGLAMLGVWGMAGHADVEKQAGPMRADDMVIGMPTDFSGPAMPTGFSATPPDLGGGSSSDAKQAAYNRMLEAEQRFLLANAQYEAAQAVYEQQRNFNNANAGRFGAQGINLPQAQPPDPSLAVEAEAARQAYEAAKAEYEALK